MRCVHCQIEFTGSYCPKCWAKLTFASHSPRRFTIATPLKKRDEKMKDEKIKTIMEVIDDEIKGLPKSERLEILTQVSSIIDISIAAIEFSE